MAPSPTADATRLTEPLRTSPTARIPGWLVSSTVGRQESSDSDPAPPAGPAATPVFM